jgi:hypothetical protein
MLKLDFESSLSLQPNLTLPSPYRCRTVLLGPLIIQHLTSCFLLVQVEVIKNTIKAIGLAPTKAKNLSAMSKVGNGVK